ncbi:hypothetical protein [Polaribacter sp. IC073]|nr:hypothetical protein [Polaribacter sp. IC073]
MSAKEIREVLVNYDMTVNRMLGADEETQRLWSENNVDKYLTVAKTS